ncbi:hypothetical protein GX408_16310, partial [bacterium]|nr:hypothetical protein [bacterium]
MKRGLCIAVMLAVSACPLYSRIRLDSLLAQVDQRSRSYAEYQNISMTVLSLSRTMDKAWQPEKVVRTEKKICTHEGRSRQEILRATEIKDGVEKDITQEAAAEAAKAEEKAKAEDKHSERREKKFELEELLPFAVDKRPFYQFELLADTTVENRRLLCIRAKAIDKDEERFEGLYFIDPQTRDVRMIDIQPAKNPKFVKELRMRMSFDVLPGDRLILTRTWMRIYAGV